MAGAPRRVERRLAAIFATDVAGYARLINHDEVGTLRALAAHRQIMDGLIAEHGGRIANTAGDSVLAEVPSAVDAVPPTVQCWQEASSRGPELGVGGPFGGGMRNTISRPSRSISMR